MDTQLQKLLNAHTWSLTPLPHGKKAIPCKWVYSLKHGAKEDQHCESARLVARGDLQRPGEDYGETFAPVIKLVSFRILLTLTAISDVKLHHWDVVAAFLHGDLSEEVYMKQPPGYDDKSGNVFLLHKSIYGLCQSSRTFYLHLDTIMRELNWRRLHSEWAIWISPDKSSFMASHVDDMLVGASPQDAKLLRTHLEKYLQITDFGDASIYIGIHISRNHQSRTISIQQSDYIDKVLQAFHMSGCNPVSTLMAESDRERVVGVHTELLSKADMKTYQRIIGCLLFLVHGTRPDLAYSVIRLAQFSARPERHHFEALKRILRYLKANGFVKGYSEAIFGQLRNTQ